VLALIRPSNGGFSCVVLLLFATNFVSTPSSLSNEAAAGKTTPDKEVEDVVDTGSVLRSADSELIIGGVI
jgi:hypothetical protein